jgi:hypothetical protein
MVDENMSAGWVAKALCGFIAGFLATLFFHQVALALMWGMDFAPYKPFALTPTRPLGVPAVFSLAFWGGIWGIIFALIQGRFPRGAMYWVTATVFGGVAASLVAFVIVLPLKGLPMGGGWHLPGLLRAFIINGAWGIGTGLFFKGLVHLLGRVRTAAVSK